MKNGGIENAFILLRNIFDYDFKQFIKSLIVHSLIMIAN